MKGLDIETIQQHYSLKILKGFQLESYVSKMETELRENRQNNEADLKLLFLFCKQFFFFFWLK
jgi:hypothetical protein